MQDWDGKALSDAMALRHKLPSLIPMQTSYGDWSRRVCTSILAILYYLFFKMNPKFFWVSPIHDSLGCNL